MDNTCRYCGEKISLQKDDKFTHTVSNKSLCDKQQGIIRTLAMPLK